MFRRFPTEYQMDSQDCGPASLKMVAKYFGRYYSLQYLRDKCGMTKEGVTLLDNRGLKPAELKLAESIVEENKEIIAARWNEYFKNLK